MSNADQTELTIIAQFTCLNRSCCEEC